jgi:hypothetical protein
MVQHSNSHKRAADIGTAVQHLVDFLYMCIHIQPLRSCCTAVHMVTELH